jgi:aldose 1-epimerase
MTSLSAARPSNQQKNATFAKRTTVDKTKDGKSTDLVELSLDCGSKACFLTYGARIVSLCGADSQNVVLSLDTLAAYESDKSYQGASIGRVCNRIKDGQLTIGNNTYQLSQNEATTCTHGGLVGFDKHVWKIESLGHENSKAHVVFSTFSPDGDQGFPGDIKATVKYELEWKADNACTILHITYEAESLADVPTVVNLTNHVYWNLSGKQEQGEDIWSHSLCLGTKEYLETDAKLLPTGRILQAESKSYLDFTEERLLKGPPKEESGIRNGYDHFFVFDKTGPKSSLEWMSTVRHAESKRTLKLYSDQPGVQFYTGTFLQASTMFPYHQYQGFCLEPSGFIDAVHHPNFPSILLRPRETRTQKMQFHLACSS